MIEGGLDYTFECVGNVEVMVIKNINIFASLFKVINNSGFETGNFNVFRSNNKSLSSNGRFRIM